MPKFPSYESERSLTTQQPSFLAPASTEGRILEKTAEVGKVAQNLSAKWLDTLVTAQKTTAQRNMAVGMNRILTDATNDPDTDSSAKYYREVENLKNENLKGFKLPGVRDQMAMELGYQADIGKIKVENIFKKKVIDAGRAAVLDLLDINAKEGNTAGIEAEIAAQEQSNLFDKEDLHKLESRYIATAKYNNFLLDFHGDPVGAEKKYNSNAYGFDVETAEKARIKLKELKTIQREQEGDLFGKMNLRLLSGELTESEIDSEMEANRRNPNEGITELHAKQLKLAFYRDITKRIGTKEYKKYREAIDYIFSESGLDRIRMYEGVLEIYADGVSAGEAGFLQKIIDLKKDKKFAVASAQGHKILETIFGARPKNMREETEFLLNYARQISETGDPQEAVRRTTMDITNKDHPATVLDPDIAAVFSPAKGLKPVTKVKKES